MSRLYHGYVTAVCTRDRNFRPSRCKDNTPTAVINGQADRMLVIHHTDAMVGATSILRPSARGKDEQRAAASLLHQSELHGGCNCRNTLHVLCWGRQALSARVPEAEASTHLDSATELAPSSSCKLAPSVGASWRLPLQEHIARAWLGAASTLRPSARGRDEHAP